MISHLGENVLYNLKYVDGTLNSEVKKYPIRLSFEEFSHVCNLTYSDYDYECDNSEESNNFNSIDSSISF